MTAGAPATDTSTRATQAGGAPPRSGALRTALLAVIAVALLVIGGALAVALGIGDDEAPATPGADSVDAGFSRDMSIHHDQGVEMANLALERSTDPAIRGLAFDIAETQNNQVGRMRGWLALWGLTPTGGERMAWMADSHTGGHDMSGMDGALMPGMATEEELAELRTLSGTEFDVQFLRLMIRHHEGGAGMAQYGAEHADQAVVRSLAASIGDSQAAETSLMVGLLSARGGTPLPPP
ncbi:DUF305 domain-containing protein [Trujillonella endophytica]|uniref:Uncharacterized conserved protein, DUF305 family n=1 Tax=Trujillonella endophytica TaxID=673521 RepID=A0A1H8TLL4_9ACTN|nr:DUF305 domain-containing protein [Trujillella endophytica]SEO91474.1 Uncharacterized conserved protein, DUF305 family [Trujillella endophytica]